MKVIGIAAAYYALPWVAGNSARTWTLYTLLSVLHFAFNVLAMRALSLERTVVASDPGARANAAKAKDS